jgi:hypothetical protein
LPSEEIQAHHKGVWQFHYENVLGTSLDLKIDARSATDAERAVAAVRHEIEREAGVFSAWDSSSEFSRWFATTGQPVRVSPDLFEMFSSGKGEPTLAKIASGYAMIQELDEDASHARPRGTVST